MRAALRLVFWRTVAMLQLQLKNFFYPVHRVLCLVIMFHPGASDVAMFTI